MYGGDWGACLRKGSEGGGNVWCRKCGEYAVEKAMGLTKVCPGVPSSYGSSNLKRIRKVNPHTV